MDRQAEIERKHQQLQQWMSQHGHDALLLKKARNVSWITAGAEPIIDPRNEVGVFGVAVTADSLALLTNNIEHERLKDEEDLYALGFEPEISGWHEAADDDTLSDDDPSVEDALQAMRSVLTEGERTRLRALGRAAADAVESTLRTARPGVSEYELSARLAVKCIEWGGEPVVNMTAFDERITNYRHPLSTDNTLKETAMQVLCMAKGGLIVALTRMVHLGPIDWELDRKMIDVAIVDATAIANSRPGRTLGSVFEAIQDAYATHDVPDQWKNHHQGGLIGYKTREKLAVPKEPTVLRAGYALAWNPSIVGVKSEDTIIIDDDGFEVVTQAGDDWPQYTIEAAGRVVKRPAMLAL